MTREGLLALQELASLATRLASDRNASVQVLAVREIADRLTPSQWREVQYQLERIVWGHK